MKRIMIVDRWEYASFLLCHIIKNVSEINLTKPGTWKNNNIITIV